MDIFIRKCFGSVWTQWGRIDISDLLPFETYKGDTVYGFKYRDDPVIFLLPYIRDDELQVWYDGRLWSLSDRNDYSILMNIIDVERTLLEA